MGHMVAVYFDDRADRAIRSLWRRLAAVGAAGGPLVWPPHMRFAAAQRIPHPARQALKEALGTLTFPTLSLSNIGTFPSGNNILMLAAVANAELLAAHATVNDVLAGQVEKPDPYYLPGAWVPYCTLAYGVPSDKIGDGFAALHPIDAIEARVEQVVVYDNVSGESDVIG